MRLSTFTTLLLPSVAYSFVLFPQPAHPPPEALLASATASPASQPSSSVPKPTANPIDLREIVDNPAATLAPTAAGAVTTQWVETEVNGVKTWMPVAYTYNFASVVSQAPEPGKGVVGMGTLTGKVGVTKTVQAAAAETMAGGAWRKGVVMAAAVGAVGLVV